MPPSVPNIIRLDEYGSLGSDVGTLAGVRMGHWAGVMEPQASHSLASFHGLIEQ